MLRQQKQQRPRWAVLVILFAGIAGAELVTVPAGALNRGIAVADRAAGTGYILYSRTPVHARFSAYPPLANSSSHFVAVRTLGDEWHYNDNWYWRRFVPEPGDRLVASVDFALDSVVPLPADQPPVAGVSRGMVDGDLAFQANRWNGVFNKGEFQVVGSWFSFDNGIDPVQRQARNLGPRGQGVAAPDLATGLAYLLLSASPTTSRFEDLLPGHDNDFVVVRPTGDGWEYAANETWEEFAVADGDRVVAEIDLASDVVTWWQGRGGWVYGLPAGFVAGDLTAAANRWGGIPDSGEFELGGTFVEFADPPRALDDRPYCRHRGVTTALPMVSIPLHGDAMVSVEPWTRFLASSNTFYVADGAPLGGDGSLTYPFEDIAPAIAAINESGLRTLSFTLPPVVIDGGRSRPGSGYRSSARGRIAPLSKRGRRLRRLLISRVCSRCLSAAWHSKAAAMPSTLAMEKS